MTKRDLITLLEIVPDEAVILVLQDEQWRPAKAEIHTNGLWLCVTIEPERQDQHKNKAKEA